jgi:hypothetical protein
MAWHGMLLSSQPIIEPRLSRQQELLYYWNNNNNNNNKNKIKSI